MREHGVSGLFRGAPATIFRESPGCGIYFASYEVTKQWLEQRWGLGEQASSFGAGGFAGGISWLLVYPFDVVKSVQQVRFGCQARVEMLRVLAAGTWEFLQNARVHMYFFIRAVKRNAPRLGQRRSKQLE